jgi:hypothetical protein
MYARLGPVLTSRDPRANAPGYRSSPVRITGLTMLVGNGTVAVDEAKNTYVQGSYIHSGLATHADPTDVVTMYYRSLSSSTEQGLPFRTRISSARSP